MSVALSQVLWQEETKPFIEGCGTLEIDHVRCFELLQSGSWHMLSHVFHRLARAALILLPRRHNRFDLDFTQSLGGWRTVEVFGRDRVTPSPGILGLDDALTPCVEPFSHPVLAATWPLERPVTPYANKLISGF